MKGIAALVLCAFALAVAGCGGSSGSTGPRLSKAAYQKQLAKISTEVRSAQQSIAQDASSAKTVAQLQDVVRRYADAGDRFGTQLGNLNPPADAAKANAELAQGEHDNASDTKAVIPNLSKFKTVQQALSYLGAHAPTNGSKEITKALDTLKRLGYTVGS